MRFFLSILSLSLLCACIKVEPQNFQQEKRFDLPAFFETEAKRLHEIKDLNVRKTVLQNGKTEEQKTKIEDWNKELTIFKKYNIHKPQVFEEYQEKRENLDGGKYHLTYQTKNPKLNLKQVDLWFNQDDQIQEIILKQTALNQVYESDYKLSYKPEEGYTIEKLQKVILFEKDRFQVILRFLEE